jgi:hypothetical protein
MNKRGEIYILGAIILATILYSLATTINYIKQESLDDDFEKISKNYELESSKLINNLLSQGDEDIKGSFNSFTALFTSYSKSQNPSYGLIYVLSFEDEDNYKIQIGNYFDKKIYIEYGQSMEEIQGCFTTIQATLTFDGLTLDPEIEQTIESCKLILDYQEGIDFMRIGIENDDEIIWYNLEIIKGKPQIMIISRLEEGQQRRVFIGGEGFVIPKKKLKDVINNNDFIADND